MTNMEQYTKNQRLEFFRKYLGVTQREIADRVGFSASSVSDYEEADRDMPEEFVQHLVDAYGLNAYWLKTGNGNMFDSSTKTDETLKLYLRLPKEEREEVYSDLMHRVIK